MKQWFFLVLTCLVLVGALLASPLRISQARAVAHLLPAQRHLVASPTSESQTDSEVSTTDNPDAVASLVAFALRGRGLHPRTHYVISADFLTGGACTAWSVNGPLVSDPAALFTVKTDKHGNFNVGIMAEDCLPQEYDIGASERGVGQHFEAEFTVVS